MKGFTLMELLVVIAIIGILSVVIGSAIQGSKGPERGTREWCIAKGEYHSATDLPATCLQYFK